MSVDKRKVDPLILREARKTLKNYFNVKINILSAVYLSQPDRRNSLIRIILDESSGLLPKSIIIKQSHSEKSDDDGQEAWGRFSRDWAGLEFLNGLAIKTPLVPRFYGANKEYRFLLLEDLGNIHISLVDALTGSDKTLAEASIERYAKALGLLHGFSYRQLNSYQAILDKLNPPALVWRVDLGITLNKIAVVLEKLEISFSPDIKREISNIHKLIEKPGPFTTLIHGDICPDNVFDNHSNNYMRIIDFEWSFISNALLDGVYLRMGMPTCWCVKAFPSDIIEKFDLLYRKELEKNIPAARDNIIYYESYVSACAYWLLWSLIAIKDIWEYDSDLSDSKYLNLHPNWQLKDSLQRPRTLYRIQSFIEIARKHDALPHLRVLAEQVINKLIILWPTTRQLEQYPVFNYL